MGDSIRDIGDFISDSWDTVVTAASIIPGPWQAPALIYKGIDALSDGNIIGAGMAAYGFNGAGGFGDSLGGDYGSLTDFGGDSGGNWDYNYGDYSGGGGDYFGNDFGVFEGVDSSLGNLFSDDYSTGANEFVQNWGDNPLFSQEGVNSANSMSQGLGQFPTSGTNVPTAGDGISTSALDTSQVSALNAPSGVPSEMNPDMTGMDSGNYTGGTPQQAPTLENVTNPDYTPSYDTGLKSPDQVGAMPQKYTYENKDFLTGKTGSGLNVDTSGMDLYKPNLANAGAAQPFKQGLEMNNAPDIWKRMTTPINGKTSNGSPQATPLGLATRGVSALADIYQNNKAQDMYKQQQDKFNQSADQNAARGQTANNMWTQNFQDPMADYNNFMTGAGRQFRDQAVAKMAQGGNRRQMGGKLQSDLASMYLTHQNQRGTALAQGFNNTNPYAGGDKTTAGYIDSVKNQLAPLGQFANYASNFDLSNLYS